MKRLWLVPLSIAVLGCASAAARADDPGPRIHYGGTPVELHFDAPGANLTMVHIDNGPVCVIVSDSQAVNGGASPAIALSCDWSPK